MAFTLKDRVKDTTTSTGTGSVTLSGTAPSGFQAFSAIGNGNVCAYTIAGGGQWETGIGTYSSSGPTLSRDTVWDSSNSGSPVSFSAGSKDVFVTLPAKLLGWQQIAQISSPTGTNVDFTNIPQIYSDIMVRIDGALHNSGSSQSLFMSHSTNGTTFGGSRAAQGSATSNSAPVYGSLEFPNYTADEGFSTGCVANISTSPAGSGGSSLYSWRCTGGIKAVRFAWGSGSHNGGIYTLLGRL